MRRLASVAAIMGLALAAPIIDDPLSQTAADVPSIPPPRGDFTDEELAELRRLPNKERKRRVKTLRAKYARGNA